MIIALPNRLEYRTLGELRKAGFATTTVRGKKLSLNAVAYYVPTLTNVVALRPLGAPRCQDYFDFAGRPQ